MSAVRVGVESSLRALSDWYSVFAVFPPCTPKLRQGPTYGEGWTAWGKSDCPSNSSVH